MTAQRLNGWPAMFKGRELERVAADLEAQAIEAKARVASRRDVIETDLQRANRLAIEAADARNAADRYKRRLGFRLVWIAFRVAILAALLWGFWRIGYVTGRLS